MGVQEGKEVGQWFGPNTIAQSLRYTKLALFERQIKDKTFYFSRQNVALI